MNFARFTRAIAFFTAVVLLFALSVRQWSRPILGVGALIVCLAAIWRALDETRALEKLPPNNEWKPSQGSGRPGDLERLERAFAWKKWSAVDYDHMMRPRLYRLLANQLRAKKGIDIEVRPDAARRVVSERTWFLTAPDQELDSKIDTDDIEAVVREIERIA